MDWRTLICKQEITEEHAALPSYNAVQGEGVDEGTGTGTSCRLVMKTLLCHPECLDGIGGLIYNNNMYHSIATYVYT